MPLIEVWKDVPQYEGKYAISNHGRIFATDQRTNRARLISGSVQASGYTVLGLWRFGQAENRLLHRLVAELFIGPSELPIVRHLDGNSKHNFVWNLAWGTTSENTLDAVRHGTYSSNSAWRGVTHCIRGHEFDATNTYHYINARGTAARACRKCKAIWASDYRAKRNRAAA
jgi:hypothetical protein